MTSNILVSFLELLKVKHTKHFTAQYFNEHPHKYNLFGLSTMLSDYGIENAGVKISDKNSILSINVPFIAHTGNDFIIVERISKSQIQYKGGGERIKISQEEFFKMWTGYALIAEPSEMSEEPNYKTHFHEELFKWVIKGITLFILLFLLLFSFFSKQSHTYPGIIVLFAISSLGTYFGYLLILKQLRIQSNYADKLCSLFKYNSCNNILESDAAKFFGVISWSEIGLGYFITNVIILCFSPTFIPSLLLVNILCLPYSLWSVWYQKYRAKQWCPLCLGILLLLWCTFLAGIGFGYIHFSAINFWSLTVTGCMYLISISTINMVVPVISRSRNVENIRYEINSIKADEDVFKALLKKQPHYEVTKNNSRILMGNTDSNLLVTVFSNPHCNPCSRMHIRINKLLERNKNICVQYIFSSFNEELEISNKYLIGTYLQKKGEAKKIYDQWFEKGKLDKEIFFNLYHIKTDTQEVINEFNIHKQWKEQSGLRATPTILVNGYKLPENSKIEDLHYLTSTEI